MKKTKIKKGSPIYVDHFEKGGFRPHRGKYKKDPKELSHKMWICLPAETGRNLFEFLKISGMKRSHFIAKILNAFFKSELSKQLINQKESEE